MLQTAGIELAVAPFDDCFEGKPKVCNSKCVSVVVRRNSTLVVFWCLTQSTLHYFVKLLEMLSATSAAWCYSELVIYFYVCVIPGK